MCKPLLPFTPLLVWNANLDAAQLWHVVPRGGGGVLPYMGYMGMCGAKGYGFSAALVINRVLILAILVINRLSIFAL